MDIDDGAVESITFSTAATESKGKRNAANLPVEVGDSLPWYVSLQRDLLVRTFS